MMKRMTATFLINTLLAGLLLAGATNLPAPAPASPVVQSTPPIERLGPENPSPTGGVDSSDAIDITYMRNPAAVYCSELGYDYQVVEDANGGQHGVCAFPDRTSCDAWRFLEGHCGQNYNACTERGLETVIQSGERSPFSQDYAVCVDDEGRAVTLAADLVALEALSTGRAPEPAGPGLPPDVESPPGTEASLTAPPSFDWRNYDGANWLTGVKNQGMCGSCWAFAAVGVTEAAMNISSGNPATDPNLSEQYLVADCLPNNDCAGGWPISALNYIRDTGIPDENCLPYADGDYSTGCSFDSSSGDCDCSICTYCNSSECSDRQCTDRCSDWSSRLSTVEGVTSSSNPTRDEIKTALADHGPLAVALYMGGSFDANGVYQCTSASYVNHAVVIVGYNDAGGYWIVRNSWGSGWNGDGYFNVAYGNCLIEDFYAYAEIAGCNDGNEINDSAASATSISYGQTINADICAAGDEDFYTFTGTAGDGIAIDIDAATNGSELDSYVYLLDGDGATVLAANDDAEGSLDSHLGYTLPQTGRYYIRVRDFGGEGGLTYSYSIQLLRDQIDPSAGITTPAPDSWIDPTMQVIQASASDGGSGIRNVAFYWRDTQAGSWTLIGEDWDGSDGWTYDLDTSSLAEQDLSGGVYIYAYDWAGNSTGAGAYNLGIDRTPPEILVEAVPPYGDAPFRDFWVDLWDSYDGLSDIESYDIQYKDGTSGVWTDWLVGTTDTSARFVGEDDHTYYFRARARDYAGNQSAYSDGSTQHAIDLCPVAPDAYEPDDTSSSASLIVPDEPRQTHNVHAEGDQDWVRFYAAAGITYTLSTTTTGDHADTVLTLYDTDATTILAINDDDPDRWPASRIDWQPTANGFYWAMVEHWDPYGAGCTTGYGLSITGTAPTPALSQGIYLPLVLNNRE